MNSIFEWSFDMRYKTLNVERKRVLGETATGYTVLSKTDKKIYVAKHDSVDNLIPVVSFSDGVLYFYTDTDNDEALAKRVFSNYIRYEADALIRYLDVVTNLAVTPSTFD